MEQHLAFFLTIFLLPTFYFFVNKISKKNNNISEVERIRINQEAQIIRDISKDNITRWSQK